MPSTAESETELHPHCHGHDSDRYRKNFDQRRIRRDKFLCEQRVVSPLIASCEDKNVKCCLMVLLAALAASAQMTEIAAQRIRAHVKFLASDLLEGRGVGARGGDLATEYIATQFALAGAKPVGDNGTYFQNFTLVGVEPQPQTELSATTRDGKTMVVPLA